MTDKEIIKALECCAKGTTSNVCLDCPLRFSDICTEVENGAMKLALDLINRQQAEIERLTINMNAFGLGMKREKERANTIKSEAIKEFAEKVQIEINQMQKNNYTTRQERIEELEEEQIFIGVDTTVQSIDSRIHTLNIIREFICNLVKEMVGEQK
jgi:hypothetical protein